MFTHEAIACACFAVACNCLGWNETIFTSVIKEVIAINSRIPMTLHFSVDHCFVFASGLWDMQHAASRRSHALHLQPLSESVTGDCI
jgi:hypothetical protein